MCADIHTKSQNSPKKMIYSWFSDKYQTELIVLYKILIILVWRESFLYLIYNMVYLLTQMCGEPLIRVNAISIPPKNEFAIT